MIPPAEYEEGLQRASDELGLMCRWGVDYAMDAVWTVMRAYDDDEESTE